MTKRNVVMPTITYDPVGVAKLQCFRLRSKREICGLPWYHIAFGPDPDQGETRGHARGVIALGDSATGVIAIGTFARGFIAFGVVALGIVACGPCALAVVLSVGALSAS